MEPSPHPTHHYILWLCALIVPLFIIGWFFRGQIEMQLTRGGAQFSPPPPTESDFVAAQKGFQHLVIYADSGFSPLSLVVKTGETVRFSAAANRPLDLSVAGEKKTLARGEYYEYTFDQAGDFTYSDGTITGSVTVK